MERENRKVLISFKISTLLLIIVSIVVIAIVSNRILNKNSNNSNNIANDNSENVEEIKSEINAVVEVQNTERVIAATISSRSSEPRNSATISELHETVGLIEHSIQEEVEATTPIEEVTISKDMDLTVRTGLSRQDFITLMAGVEEDTSGFFEENAGLIYDICEEYQINEIFFCGLIAGESGWRIADNHRRTYNYISLMSGGKLIRYNSVEDGLEKAAKTLHNNYLTEGGKFYYGPTLSGVKTRFCPASSTWTNLIYGNMQRILK